MCYRMIPISPPKLLVPKSATVLPEGPSNSKEDNLERTILAMASLDLPTAIQSMNSIDNVSII